MMTEKNNPEVTNETVNQTNDSVEQEQTQNLHEESKEENETELSDHTPSLEEQLSVANDKYLRLNAEFDNYRKRTAKERIELINTASKDVLKRFIGSFR